jgi:hypothetical protein
MLTESEQKLVEQLRKEATDVKDCFARYSFQAMAFVAPALGVIVSLQATKWPLVGLASIPIILLILAICRIGIYKYSTANRLHGFELHLHRLDSTPDTLQSPWDAEARKMGWEEGMRAWRTVQATMYRALYYCWPLLPQKPRRKWTREPFRWYEPSHLVGSAVYYTGHYLRSLMKILYAMIAFAYACLAWTAVAALRGHPQLEPWMVWGIVILTLSVGCRILFATWQINSRIACLEGGILSIHSCALMWHAVAVIHARALRSLFAQPGPLGLKGYHREIGKLALELSEKPLDLHEWIYAKGDVESGLVDG